MHAYHPMCQCSACYSQRLMYPADTSVQVGYYPGTYNVPPSFEQYAPQLPAQVTINWGEVIVGAVIGAVIGRWLR